MDDSLLQTSPSPILCKQSVPVGRAPEQARLPVAFPDSGGEFREGGLTKYIGATRLRGHLVMVILVKIDFGNAVICSLYINILIFIL